MLKTKNAQLEQKILENDAYKKLNMEEIKKY